MQNNITTTTATKVITLSIHNLIEQLEDGLAKAHCGEKSLEHSEQPHSLIHLLGVEEDLYAALDMINTAKAVYELSELRQEFFHNQPQK